MKIQQFLEHHEIARNPFAEEDAQTDPVFKEHCISSTYHPAWDKVYGDPREPATSVVFGEKGSGKTAMRLQIARHLDEYNAQNKDQRLYVIEYDDFNPFLDRFRETISRRRRRRRADKVLAEWKLWDHIDAILSVAVSRLVDRTLGKRTDSSPGNEITDGQLESLDRYQTRDFMLLAAFYDQSIAGTFQDRWNGLRKRLKFSTWKSYGSVVLGLLTTVVVVAILVAMLVQGQAGWLGDFWFFFLAVLLGGWMPWCWRFWHCFCHARSVIRRMRVGNHTTFPLCRVLRKFTSSELAAQPIPNKDSTDDRYEMLMKFQGIIESFGFTGIVVLVDRVDEPYLINGSADLMKALIWPMLDNKFLKHPGLGVKMMLPIELTRFIDREDRDFFQRARLDKQNMISSFEWTGEALCDVANARIRACSPETVKTDLFDLIQESISESRVLDSFRSLRVPRHMFKFMYRLLVAHCNAHTEQNPEWKISGQTFESTLALYLRDQDAFDRGMGAG